jgi:predicted TIM-barrel fold metal-dependent hydrolase
MTEYEVIDAHVHTYKTAEIGRQALSGFDASGCCGMPEELVAIMQAAGIRQAVQCNMTPARSMLEASLAGVPPDQVEAARPALLEKISDRIRRRNEWTCRMAEQQPGLVAFISVDPMMGQEAMLAELLDKIDNHGARGLKIHPGEGRFFPDDPSLGPVYDAMVERGLPVISHGGLDIANPDPSFTRPAAFAGVAGQYPDLKLVIAHLGNNFFDESVKMAAKYPNIFFDTSAVIPGDEKGQPLSKKNALADAEAVQLIRHIGIERVMFGTDYPWFHPLWDLKRFLKLDFGKAEKEALLAGNAKRILGL